MNEAGGDTKPSRRRRFRLWEWIVLIVVLACLFGIAVGTRDRLAGAGLAARRTQCLNNLKQLGFALHAFANARNQLPPAATSGPDGQPWHSWRLAIVPSIESSDFYARYRRDEPWDGPNNRMLDPDAGTRFVLFRCPDHLSPGRCSYVAVTGPGTAFPGPDESTVLQRLDPDTVLVVESHGLAPHWMEPRDLGPSDLETDRGPSSTHGGLVNVLFADGSVKSLPPEEVRERIRAMYRRGVGNKGDGPD